VLAGADGNPGAHIFCRRLAAELVAIDGYYRMADEIAPNLLEKPIHAWLENDALNIKALD
jgi:septum site-determining protein MinC